MARKPQARPNVRTAAQPSAAQLAANRANAQASTGPRTEEGKARSSQNAVKHGLYSRRTMERLTGPENAALRAEYEAHLAGLQAYWKPEGEQEETLVDNLADQDWHVANRRRQKDLYLDDLRARHEFAEHEMNPRLLDDVDLYLREEAHLERSVNTLLRHLQHLRRWHPNKRVKPGDTEPEAHPLTRSPAHWEAALPSPLPEAEPEMTPVPEAAPAAEEAAPESETVSQAKVSVADIHSVYQYIDAESEKQTHVHPDDVASWSKRQGG